MGSQSELLSTVKYGISNDAIARKLLFFLMWLIEQKIFVLYHIIDVRDKPARPSCTAVNNGNTATI